MALPGWMASALLFACALPVHALAAELNLREDGWYRWEVPAGPEGRDSCCYEFRRGRLMGGVGCRLGHGEEDFAPLGDCDVSSDTMQVFVELRQGQVREVRALSSACPVSTDADLRTIEGVSTAESIAWLTGVVEAEAKVADEAVMAVSFHSEREALDALITLIEDKRLRRDTREQAIFWLVQSESDEAFAYLDRLLD